MSDTIKKFQRRQLSLDTRMNAINTEAIKQEADDKGYELLEEPYSYFDGRMQVVEARGMKQTDMSDNPTTP